MGCWTRGGANAVEVSRAARKSASAPKSSSSSIVMVSNDFEKHEKPAVAIQSCARRLSFSLARQPCMSIVRLFLTTETSILSRKNI
jgi:hypothetical protein